jgi:hypothetical protein
MTSATSKRELRRLAGAKPRKPAGMPSRWCCAACRRDLDALTLPRHDPNAVSERIEEIAEVLHGYDQRECHPHTRRRIRGSIV